MEKVEEGQVQQEEKAKLSSSESKSSSSTSSSEYSYSEEEEEEEEEDYYDYDQSWISAFCNYKAFKHWYCRVSPEFLWDNFNLYGLNKIIPKYDKALERIRDDSDYYDSSDSDEEVKNDERLEVDTQYLYMLIHQRYITSPEGLDDMYDKFERGVFGKCPRVECNKQHVLPYGMSTNINVSGTLVFCPRCRDIYIPKNTTIASMDGAAFGPNFATLFLSERNVYNKIAKVKNCRIEIFGFKCNDKMRRLNREHPEIIAPTRESDDYYSEYEEEDDE